MCPLSADRLLGRRFPAAELAAPTHVCVQPVQHIDPVLQLAQCHVAEGGLDCATDVAGCGIGRAQFVVDQYPCQPRILICNLGPLNEAPELLKLWSRLGESNPRPTHYEYFRHRIRCAHPVHPCTSE
jgi:hypothetical protein